MPDYCWGAYTCGEGAVFGGSAAVPAGEVPVAALSPEVGVAPAALFAAPAPESMVLSPPAWAFGGSAVGPPEAPGAGGVASIIIAPFSAGPPIRENAGTGERGISTLGIAADGMTADGIGDCGIGFEGMLDAGIGLCGIEEFGIGVIGIGLDGMPEALV